MGFFSKLLLLSLIGALSLLVPQIYRGAVWLLIHEEVLRQGGVVRIGAVEGVVWENLRLKSVRISLPGSAGALLHAEMDSVDCQFSWINLIPMLGRGRFIEVLSVRGGKFDWAVVPDRVGLMGGAVMWPRKYSFGEAMEWPVPTRIDLELTEASVRSVDWDIQFGGVKALLSTVAPGEFKAAKLDCRVQSWSKNFRDLQCKAAVVAGRLQLGDLELVKGVKFSTFAVGLSDVVNGRVDLEMHAQAFGGEVRIQAEADPSNEKAPFDASGTFAGLSMAPLASFLGAEAAGGVLEQGKFSFRGEPSNPGASASSLRVEAKNFQWESRQWDSLVLGATLVDRRIQIPELSLRQGQNQLVLNGEMQWPGGSDPWWKADFGMNVTARIDNLTELSALLLPEFKYAAGALTVDGAIRSQAGTLGGALILTGNKLTWRKAPIDEFNAAIKLRGADIQVLNIDLSRGADLLKGKGVFRIGENWSYEGELRGGVADLEKYVSLLEPQLSAGSFGGGLQLEWTGKGAPSGHEGRVQCQFRALHPLAESPRWSQPMSGEVSGTYAAGRVSVDSLTMGDEKVKLETRLTISDGIATFSDLVFSQGNRRALSGTLAFPSRILQGWPNIPEAASFAPADTVQANLRMDGLDLAQLRRLPGLSPTIAGGLDGQWEMNGPLNECKGLGSLRLRDAALPVKGALITSLNADCSLEDRMFRMLNLSGNFGAPRYEGFFTVRSKDGEPNVVDAALSSKSAVWKGVGGMRFPLLEKGESSLLRLSPLEASGSIAWTLSGPVTKPLLKADVTLKNVNFGGVPDLRLFWSRAEGARRINAGLDWEWAKDCKLEIKVVSAENVEVHGTTGAVNVALTASGSAAAPDLEGEVRMVLRGAVGGIFLDIEPLAITFARGQEPSLEIEGKGMAGPTPFAVSVKGPFSQPQFSYKGAEPLSAEKLKSVFEEGKGW